MRISTQDPGIIVPNLLLEHLVTLVGYIMACPMYSIPCLGGDFTLLEMETEYFYFLCYYVQVLKMFVTK